ncbi:MAG TPA: hypothetical protein VFN86_01090 [Casimicrobiaceae bacterium]|nr:hypothetical protein [Casimicrobiaceae bacterium]
MPIASAALTATATAVKARTTRRRPFDSMRNSFINFLLLWARCPSFRLGAAMGGAGDHHGDCDLLVIFATLSLTIMAAHL